MTKLIARLSTLVATCLVACIAYGVVPSAAQQLQNPPSPPIWHLGSVSIYDSPFAPSNTTADNTVNVTKFLYWAQMQFYARKGFSTSLDDQMQRACIDARIPFQAVVTSPVIVPIGVCLTTYPQYGFRMGSPSQMAGGVAANTYTGDPTTKQLINPSQFMLIGTPGSVIGDTILFPHNGGSQFTSGFLYGKNWQAVSATVFAGGTNYTNGDVLNCPQPNRSPYVACQLTVTNAIGGVIQPGGVSVSTPGSYSLPPWGQTYQWTTANHFTGPIANGDFGTVFDPSNAGVMITACSSCTNGGAAGAEVTIGWDTDFNGDGTDYKPGAVLVVDALIGNLNIKTVGSTNDPTWGHQVGVRLSGGAFFTGSMNIGSGFYGLQLNGSDFHFGGGITPVSAIVGLKINGASSIDMPNLTIDTPVTHCAEIDNASGVSISGRAFLNPTTVSTMADGCILLGFNSSSSAAANTNLDLKFTISNTGANGSAIPAMSCAYTRDSTINLNVSNTQKSGSLVNYPNNYYGLVGTDCEANNRFLGSIDNYAQGSVWKGQAPVAGAQIWDGMLQQWAIINTNITTNVLTSPQAFNNSTWTANLGPFITDNAATAPDGTQSASVFNYTQNTQRISAPIPGASAATPLCISVYIQGGFAGNRSFILRGGKSDGTAEMAALFTSGGIFTSDQSNGGGVLNAYYIKKLPNNWYRYTIEGTGNGAVEVVGLVNNSGTTGQMNVWGFQVEPNFQSCPGQYNPQPFGNLLTVNASSKVTISSANPVAPPTAISGTVDQSVGADTTTAAKEVDSFGGTASFRAMRNDGTNTTPTAVQSGEEEGSFNARGNDASGSSPANSNATFRAYAEENQSSTNHGAEACIGTTANGTTAAPTDSFCQHNNGGVTVGVATNEGAGTINPLGETYSKNGFPVPYVIGQFGSPISSGNDTNEDVLGSVVVPANTMGANGCVVTWTLWSYTNSANNKTLHIRFGGTGTNGTAYYNATFTTTNSLSTPGIRICNRNATNSQYGPQSSSAFGGSSSGGATTSSVDTTGALTIYFTGTKASAGETLTLEGYSVVLQPGN